MFDFPSHKVTHNNHSTHTSNASNKTHEKFEQKSLDIICIQNKNNLIHERI
jgi:hypothetical protein